MLCEGIEGTDCSASSGLPNVKNTEIVEGVSDIRQEVPISSSETS